jgi:hypothetical protein
MEVIRMLRRSSLAALVLFFASLLSGCAGMMGSERRESNAEVQLLSFGSTNGELAPCG